VHPPGIEEGILIITTLTDSGQTMEAMANLNAWAADIRMAYAWIHSSGGKADHWRALDRGKLTKAVVGIHFAQTEPAALRQLMQSRDRCLKVINDTAGVFHPKVIVGQRGNDVRAIVGSSNFTRGGFGGNTELNLHLEGRADDEPLATILAFVDDLWSSARAFVPDDAWLSHYEKTHESGPRPPTPPKMPTSRRPRTLDLEWDDYYRWIAEQERRMLANGWEIHVFDHEEGSFLQEAEVCAKAFRRYESFASMPLETRKHVSGVGRSWRYFGSMEGAGGFRNLVNESPRTIADHLDAIPREGNVTRGQAEAYLNAMLEIPRINLGAATRLLAVKRPDLFLAVNKGNRTRIQQVFGTAPSTTTGYLHLHDQLWSNPWASAAKPSERDQRRAWAARVALLDAYLYER
jgi:hypothetical protein